MVARICEIFLDMIENIRFQHLYRMVVLVLFTNFAVHSRVDLADVVATWRSAQAVCFDVDSTVCEDEGIDELAAFCGAGEAVAAWTARSELLSPIVYVFFQVVQMLLITFLSCYRPR